MAVRAKQENVRCLVTKKIHAVGRRNADTGKLGKVARLKQTRSVIPEHCAKPASWRTNHSFVHAMQDPLVRIFFPLTVHLPREILCRRLKVPVASSSVKARPTRKKPYKPVCIRPSGSARLFVPASKRRFLR